MQEIVSRSPSFRSNRTLLFQPQFKDTNLSRDSKRKYLDFKSTEDRTISCHFLLQILMLTSTFDRSSILQPCAPTPVVPPALNQV